MKRASTSKNAETTEAETAETDNFTSTLESITKVKTFDKYFDEAVVEEVEAGRRTQSVKKKKKLSTTMDYVNNLSGGY